MNLQKLRERLADRAPLEAELETLFARKSELEERLQRERINLEYERSDVQALEDNTLKSLLYAAIGKKEERLRKEEDEATDAERQYESTQKELAAVNARIKRIEFELRELKRAERDYELFAKDLQAKIDEISPLLSEEDAITLERLQKELDEQKQHQACFARITEAGKQLNKSIASVCEALEEMYYESKHGTVFTRQERYREAEAREKVALIQTERFMELLSENVHFQNEYCVDPDSIQTMIQRALVRCYNNTPNADCMIPDVPGISRNVEGILSELEQKTERSRQHQAEIESRLSQLLEKYQTN